VLAAALAGTAQADIALGGSKSAGMGGAGLALGHDAGGPGSKNPAWYALNKRSYFTWPQLNYSLSGLGWGDLDEFFKFGSKGVVDEDSLGRIARTFGDRKTEFGASLGFGAQFGSFAVDIRGDGFGITNPNQSLKNWVKAGSNLAAVPADAVLDGYGLGSVEIGVSGGQIIPYQGDQLAVGARVKIARGYYSHWVANAASIVNGGSIRASDMGGDDVLEKTGLGLDAGVHWSSGKYPGFTAALSANNLLEPKISFDGARPDSLSREKIKPFQRTFDVGVAYDKGPFIAAVDIVDIGGTGGQRELRFGAEVHAGRWFAVRAGYGSLMGPTIGVGVAGFNLAYGRGFPIQASYAIKF
jgi:hypothetical protein